MGYSCGGDAANAEQRLAEQTRRANIVKGYKDGRFTSANFGNGVLNTYWGPDLMDDHMALMDISSVDKYPYTSPQIRFEYGRAPDWNKLGGTEGNAQSSAAYGWQVDQMMKWQDPNRRQPIWIFVETAQPLLDETGSGVITPDQIEGAIWSAITNEARGISFFQHNNNDSTGCGFYSIVDSGCTATKTKLKTTIGNVKTLAPVINTQSYAWDFGATKIDTMLKAHDSYAYIFSSVGVGGTTGSKTFTLPAVITGTTVEVVNEGRSLSVSGGKFTDTFAAEYSHHIYKIKI